MLKKTELKTLVFLILLATLVMNVSGCRVVQEIDNLNGILETRPPDSEIGQLEQAEDAFFTGDYVLARELYSAVKTKSVNPLYMNSAHYGLTCIAIVTAANDDELKQGFEMLKEWQQPETDVAGYRENPGMIAKALNAQVDKLECEPELRYVTTKKEGELLKKHQDEINELKETIKKLEHQISVLEAIDQEIQEKRKPI